MAFADEKSRQLRVLTSVSRALTAAASPEEVLSITLSAAQELVACEAAVLVLNDDYGRPVLRASNGVSAERRIELLERPGSSPDEVLAAALGKDRALLAVPLIARDVVAGTLAVAPVSAVTPDDLWILSALADQTAVALDLLGAAGPQESEEILQLIVNRLDQHLLVALDAEGHVTSWNGAAERILGHEALAMLGQPLGAFFGEAHRAVATLGLAEARVTGRSEGEVQLVRKDGSSFWAAVQIVVRRRGDGSVRGFTFVARDVTIRLLEEERSQLLEREREALARSERHRLRAEAANRMKDEFLATVSHELRTPLTAILGWARMLRTATVDEEGREKALEVIERNALAQAKLIDDLLDVSRIIAGKVRIEQQWLSVATVLEAALETVRLTAAARDIRLTTEVSPDVGHIIGDADRLQQVVWNLLANAVKFTPRGGRVTLRASRSRDEIVLSVEDSGKGIDPAFLPAVFDRFRQDDASTTRTHDGLGLGLAIVRHLVDLHGGTVSAFSDGAGQGARFEVRVPIRAGGKANTAGDAPPPSEDPSPPPLTSTRSLAGLHILVVDDTPDACELVAAVLARAGATVQTASSAAEARGYLRELVPHVLVSDIGMPNEDGYSFLRSLRELDTSTGNELTRLRAVALTAYARPEDRDEAFAAGFHAHLTKPVDPRELVRTIGELLDAAS